MMKKKDLYVGMRVYAATDRGAYCDGIPGTIIDTGCRLSSYDCLVEFDEFVNGHSGLGWGTVEGKKGYCYWFNAEHVEEIVDEVRMDDAVTDCNISYEDLMSGVVVLAESACVENKNTV